MTENDQLFPDDVRIAGQNFLKENNVEHEIEVYPGVPHGTFFPRHSTCRKELRLWCYDS